MCWQEGRAFAHCGNLDLPQWLHYLAEHDQAQRFYLFSYPYQTEDKTAKYYCFDISAAAIEGAKIYRESMWEKLRQASEAGVVFPTFLQHEDDLTSL